jgi:hypothetical protein
VSFGGRPGRRKTARRPTRPGPGACSVLSLHEPRMRGIIGPRPTGAVATHHAGPGWRPSSGGRRPSPRHGPAAGGERAMARAAAAVALSAAVCMPASARASRLECGGVWLVSLRPRLSVGLGVSLGLRAPVTSCSAPRAPGLVVGELQPRPAVKQHLGAVPWPGPMPSGPARAWSRVAARRPGGRGGALRHGGDGRQQAP